MGKLESFELNPNIRTKVTVKTIFSQQQTNRQTDIPRTIYHATTCSEKFSGIMFQDISRISRWDRHCDTELDWRRSTNMSQPPVNK